MPGQKRGHINKEVTRWSCTNPLFYLCQNSQGITLLYFQMGIVGRGKWGLTEVHILNQNHICFFGMLKKSQRWFCTRIMFMLQCQFLSQKKAHYLAHLCKTYPAWQKPSIFSQAKIKPWHNFISGFQKVILEFAICAPRNVKFQLNFRLKKIPSKKILTKKILQQIFIVNISWN